MSAALLLHPADQPILSLGLRAEGCELELRLNDVPILRESAGEPVHGTFPVNEWLFQGMNRVHCEARAVPDAPSPRVELSVLHRQARQPLRHAATVAMLRTEGIQHAENEEGRREIEPARNLEPARVGEPAEIRWQPSLPRATSAGAVILAGWLELPPPWPVCPWQNASVLVGLPGLEHAVRQVSHQFWGLLSRRDAAAALRLAASRARDVEAVYYLSAGELEDALLFPRLLALPEWRVAPFPDEGTAIEIAGGGRLARLVLDATGESPLRLVDEGAGVEAIVDAWWAFTTRWELVR